MANRRHSGQKAKKDFRMLIITALKAPNHNCGKDEYVVDMKGHEAQYWQGTESGLLGAFEFQGACTTGAIFPPRPV